jgi:succinyl-CoA synthetase alpha subunit
MINLTKPLNVLVQGITGQHGRFHTREMLAYGTRVVAGTSPNKTVKEIESVTVFPDIKSAVSNNISVDASVIFVPAPFARAAITDAIEADIKLIVCITEGIPVHDFMAVKNLAEQKNIKIIGPNCPGILVPGVNKLGIIPENVGTTGQIALVSRSGTLTYEIAHALTKAGLGQRYIVGIGGDPIKGTSFVDTLKIFENDPAVTDIVLVGEIGGRDEQIAAEYIKKHVNKPVFAYVAGHHAPIGQQLGHAGAIIGHADETAMSKTQALIAAGCQTFMSPGELVKALAL